MARFSFPLSLALLASLHTGATAWAWARLGPRPTAEVAERNLNTKAREGVKALLKPGETLADASTWADENSRKIKGSSAWH
jgi:hypothetical protein